MTFIDDPDRMLVTQTLNPPIGPLEEVDVTKDDGTVIGTAYRRFVLVGQWCDVWWRMDDTLGFPTDGNPWGFELPVRAGYVQVLHANVWDNSAGFNWVASGYVNATTHRLSRILMDDQSSGDPRLRAGYPVTLTTNDWVMVQGRYGCETLNPF